MVGGYSVLSAGVTDITHDMEAMIEETGGLGDAWAEHSYTGVRKAMLSQKGFYDDDALSVHAMLEAGLGTTSRVLLYGLEGTATGAAFLGLSAVETKYRKIASRGMLHKAEADYVANGIVDQGKIVRMLNQTTASGNTTGAPLDNGVSSTNQSGAGAGYLAVTALSASGAPFVAQLRQSSDNITYANLGSAFTGLASAAVPAAQRLAITATAIERYTAVDWTFTGGSATNAAVTFFAGIVRY